MNLHLNLLIALATGAMAMPTSETAHRGLKRNGISASAGQLKSRGEKGSPGRTALRIGAPVDWNAAFYLLPMCMTGSERYGAKLRLEIKT
ncbi:hypothetical protein PABG_05479 [Paracoccidioides brasiliensis Pb03]|uniref:Uncharacterized protein n=1 Tax=Paracoccidioides brasiliensis TaxID=121759 RepID=A0A1D2JBD3_PARBR|nr:hypothetical protein PABG_05479 [Paracoccidioides brasiliensis Pb03]ODH25784.1 hypothetical protein ACO22_05087 [Paracoccidioides brasiliensis]ODH52888.1 hypothetical protein GX48_01082 [Paracoccidioides brasiliensis]